MTLGQRISQYRKTLGISQEELGGRLGVSRQAVSKWETDAAVPDMNNLIALAREFGISVAELTETPGEAAATETPEIAAIKPVPPRSDGRRFFWPMACGVLAATLAIVLLTAALSNRTSPSEPGMLVTETDFALIWTGSDGTEEFLELGIQEEFFPFGTSLEPAEWEEITDSGFPDDTYHDVVCGALSLRYSHIAVDPPYEILRMLETESRNYQTPRGIGVGSTETELLKIYGDDLIYCQSTYGPDTAIVHDHYYVYTSEGTASLLFLIAGEHVAGIRMEDASYPYYHVNHVDSFPVKDGAPDFSQRQERPKTTEHVVYDALNALMTRDDLTAEEAYTDHWTIFNGLSDLDWWAFGDLGATEYPDDTISTLLSWLREQAPYSEDEILRLQLGCRSNLDGWLADSYAHVLSGALFAAPVEFVKGLACADEEDCMSDAVSLTAYDAIWYSQELAQTVETLETALSSGTFTEAQAGWCRLLLLYLTTETEDGSFAGLPKLPSDMQ